MAKYDGVTAHLRGQALDARSVELSFSELDRLCGGLPPSARRARTWWANNSQSQAKAWRAAGWHVDSVDLNSGHVAFRRGVVGGGHATAMAHSGSTPAPRRRARKVEALGDTFGSLVVKVELEWTERGGVRLNDQALEFPNYPPSPGVYRFFLTGGHLPRPKVYIGETRSLRQRMSNYRRPGPRAKTSVRVNAILREHLAEGGLVNLATCESVRLWLGDARRPADLSLKRERVLAEHAALVAECEPNAVDIANL